MSPSRQLAEIEGRAAAEAGSAHHAHAYERTSPEAVCFVHGWLVARVEADIGHKILPDGAPIFEGFDRPSVSDFARVAEAAGWKLDISPVTEGSGEIWWRHGGTFELRRQQDLMDQLLS